MAKGKRYVDAAKRQLHVAHRKQFGSGRFLWFVPNSHGSGQEAPEAARGGDGGLGADAHEVTSPNPRE